MFQALSIVSRDYNRATAAERAQQERAARAAAAATSGNANTDCFGNDNSYNSSSSSSSSRSGMAASFKRSLIGSCCSGIGWILSFLIIAPIVWLSTGAMLGFQEQHEHSEFHYFPILAGCLLTGFPFIGTLMSLANLQTIKGRSLRDNDDDTDINLPSLVSSLRDLNSWLAYWALWPALILIQSYMAPGYRHTIGVSNNKVKIDTGVGMPAVGHELRSQVAYNEAVAQAAANGDGNGVSESADKEYAMGIVYEQVLLTFAVWASFFGGGYFLSIVIAKVLGFICGCFGSSMANVSLNSNKSIDSGNSDSFLTLSSSPTFMTKLFSTVLVLGFFILLGSLSLTLEAFQLCSYVFTICLWWGSAFSSAFQCLEINEMLNEITSMVINQKKLLRFVALKKTLSNIEEGLRGQITFWLISALYAGIILNFLQICFYFGEFGASHVPSFLALYTPAVVVIGGITLGPQFGSLLSQFAKPLVTGGCKSLCNDISDVFSCSNCGGGLSSCLPSPPVIKDNMDNGNMNGGSNGMNDDVYNQMPLSARSNNVNTMNSKPTTAGPAPASPVTMAPPPSYNTASSSSSSSNCLDFILPKPVPVEEPQNNFLGGVFDNMFSGKKDNGNGMVPARGFLGQPLME